MVIIKIHEDQSYFSWLLDQAARDETFVVAKVGKPIIGVVPQDIPEGGKCKRSGFMDGRIKLPEDFDTMGADDIEVLFHPKP